MTEDQFLRALTKQLKNLEPRERENLLAEYRAHFASGKEAGKSEDEIAADANALKTRQRSLSKRKYLLIAGIIIAFVFLVLPIILVIIAYLILSV